MKKYKYRVKDLSNDGTVKLTDPDDKHYVDICIEELLDTLNEDV